MPRGAPLNRCLARITPSPLAPFRSPEGVEAFVQCAYEFVQEVGFEEARRAFHEEARWRSGQIYVFVDEVSPMFEMSRSLVYPPDGAREGNPWGPLPDGFGGQWYEEQHRLVSNFGEGWIYYTFTNPVTGMDAPKASYLKGLDWGRYPRLNRRGDLSPRSPRHVQK